MLKKTNPLQKLNREMKLFLLRLIIFIVSWQSLYIFLLKPHRIPDEWLTNRLTVAVTATLNFFFGLTPPVTWQPQTGTDANLVQQHGHTLLVIFDDCNGLDLFIIYLAFIWLLPYPAIRKLVFSIGGLIAIFIGNIVRCVALYWVYVHYKSMFDFNHHYVFTIIMYLIIFYGWILFTKKSKNYEVR